MAAKPKVRLTHMAVDASIYETVAAYALALGYRPRVFFEKAALYAKNHQLNREWQEIFVATAPRSPRRHDLDKDCRRQAAKAEKMPPDPVEPPTVEPPTDVAQIPDDASVDDILNL